jgi:4-carboxymuconolactone decarboxylase
MNADSRRAAVCQAATTRRRIATVAALTVSGNAQPKLKAHLNSALSVGCNREEVIEIVMQMTPHAGFPATLNGVFAAKEVFAERDEGLA